MTRVFCSLFLIAGVTFAPGCASGPKKGSLAEEIGDTDAGLGLSFPLQQHKLRNGLKVLLVEDHTVPLVSYQTWVNAGSVDEEFGFTGIAHLFEHLMFKGSEKYGPRAFFTELEAKGALVNAYTSRDYTVFHETFVPALLGKAIELESDRLANLKLTEDLLSTERQVVFEERRLRVENSPEGRLQEAVWSLVFRSHPYRWPVIGYAEDLTRIELKNLTDFFQKYYTPANVTLVVVGDFKPAEALSKIKAAYSGIPSQARPERQVRLEPEQKEKRQLKMRDHVAAEQLVIAYPITSAKEEDTYALDVLSNILFGGISARAHQRLVEEKDIALGVSGYSYTPAYPGIFTLRSTMKGRHGALEAELEYDRLLAEVREKGVTVEEVKAAVRQLMVQTVDSVRTAHGLGTLIGTVEMIFQDPFAFRTDLEKYARVTPEDVQRVTARYLTEGRKNVIVLSPGAREEEPESL